MVIHQKEYTMTRKREYRPPIIPDGWSWYIGGVAGLFVFLLTYLTGFLDAITAGIVCFLLAMAIGIGVNLWDTKAYYYKRAYDQLDQCEEMLDQIDDTAGNVKDRNARTLLRSISEKAKRLLDPDDGIITPSELGDVFLSTVTSFRIALTTVTEGAETFDRLEESLVLDDESKETLQNAITQFNTINTWMIDIDRQLRSADRIGLNALNAQMKSYKFRTL
jgi:hypothetical protein